MRRILLSLAFLTTLLVGIVAHAEPSFAAVTCGCDCIFTTGRPSRTLDPINTDSMGPINEDSTADAEAACTERCTRIAEATISDPAVEDIFRDREFLRCTEPGSPIPSDPTSTTGGSLPSRPSTNTNSTGAVVGEGGARGAPAPTLPNPLGGTTDIRTIIGRVINAALGISGSIALLMFVWGGLQWLTSGGSPERIQKGKNTIVWAVLGLVLIFGSYAILNFVLGAILSA